LVDGVNTRGCGFGSLRGHSAGMASGARAFAGTFVGTFVGTSHRHAPLMSPSRASAIDGCPASSECWTRVRTRSTARATARATPTGGATGNSAARATDRPRLWTRSNSCRVQVASIGATQGATAPRIVSLMVTAGATLTATAQTTVEVEVIVNATRQRVAGQHWDVGRDVRRDDSGTFAGTPVLTLAAVKTPRTCTSHSSNAGGWCG
jgi:hypothetical protein